MAYQHKSVLLLRPFLSFIVCFISIVYNRKNKLWVYYVTEVFLVCVSSTFIVCTCNANCSFVLMSRGIVPITCDELFQTIDGNQDPNKVYTPPMHGPRHVDPLCTDTNDTSVQVQYDVSCVILKFAWRCVSCVICQLALDSRQILILWGLHTCVRVCMW